MAEDRLRRQRVSLPKSFMLAGSAALKADDPTHGDASLLATIIFGVWWWIRGAPVDDSPGSSTT
jgi:hypothetical protein